MGQQQLLLLVLATVIVGLATVAGIEAFDQNQVQANGDALSGTALEIASDAQALRQKPAQLGGVSNITNVTLSDLGYSSPYNVSAGTFNTTNDSDLSVTCPSLSGNTLNVYGWNSDFGNAVCASVAADTIATALNLNQSTDN